MSAVLPSTVRLRHVVFATASAAAPRRAVDFAVAPPRLPERREPLVCHEEQDFLRWLFAMAGLDVRAYRPETLLRRLPACLRAVRAASPRECRELLLHRTDLISLAISTLVIGVTSFFRDGPVFDRLRDEILPELTRRGGKLRIWSAGCSDGAELYSVAMLLAERRVLHACRLLGTDCRRDAIARAREGLYAPAALKGLPAGFLQRYFVPDADEWRVRPDVRAALQWRVGNVMEMHEPGTWDLLLCRNMVMYLQPERTGPLFRRFESVLRPGGILVLGKAERPVGASGLASVGTCLYRKVTGINEKKTDVA